ncbi:PspC domain-containing protein [Candidatus Gracilibacteria bacterium]|nr:PspC domain-containing protein [Candidatus Gracilibacteria bacterium]
MNNRLVRSTNDRMLGGVCAGLARYFGIDATIMRLIFVVAVFSGISPLVYLILWIVMPQDSTAPSGPQNPPSLTVNQDPTGEWQYDPYTGQKISR